MTQRCAVCEREGRPLGRQGPNLVCAACRAEQERTGWEHFETGRQAYAGNDCVLSAGTVQHHPHDSLYLRFERGDEDPTTIYLRTDEVMAVIWLLSGALWSENMAAWTDPLAPAATGADGGGA